MKHVLNRINKELTWDGHSLKKRVYVVEEYGNATLRREFDPNGNVIHERYYDETGKLMINHGINRL